MIVKSMIIMAENVASDKARQGTGAVLIYIYLLNNLFGMLTVPNEKKVSKKDILPPSFGPCTIVEKIRKL